MKIGDIKKIYFIGIGGIGMSALARFFNEKGTAVSGYDKTETPLTIRLRSEGMHISYKDAESEIVKDADAVVYTPAIPADNLILNWYRDNGFNLLKRSDLLQIVTENMQTVAVAGTHGKTTTSTMIAFLLREAGAGCNAFLGGISVNYNSNYWGSDNNIAVVEADEYDRSFLKLSPQLAVLTAMDADHLDIYGTEQECQDAFISFTQKIRPGGTLVVKQGLKRIAEMGGEEKISYSLQNDAADTYAANIRIQNGGYIFDVHSKKWILQGLHLNIGGMHNIENCVAAITAAKSLDLDNEAIRNAVAAFKGIKRRFEYIVKNDRTVYIDDYAHHPEELKSLLKSAKTLFPKKKCVIAFQPHLYSRTRDFADGFASVLDMADEVLLLDIYPARETPIDGVSAQTIADKMGNPNVTVLSKEGILSYARNAPLELFITAGAGDIDQLVPELKSIIESKSA